MFRLLLFSVTWLQMRFIDRETRPIKHIRSDLIGNYDNANTYSEGLTDFALNPTVSDKPKKA